MTAYEITIAALDFLLACTAFWLAGDPLDEAE